VVGDQEYTNCRPCAGIPATEERSKMTEDVSRRELLAGIGMAGAAIGLSAVGHSTASALLADTEQFGGNVATAGELAVSVEFDAYYESSDGSTSTSSGTVDGDVADELGIKSIKPGDKGRIVFRPAITGNPGYLWFCGGVRKSAENGKPDPEGESFGDVVWPPDGPGGEIGDAIEVTLRYLDPDSDTEVDLLSGSFTDVLGALQYGIALGADPDYTATGYRALDRPGSQVCFTGTSGPHLELDWEVPNDTGNTINTDELEFEFLFHAQQCRHNDGKQNPCAIEKGISFVAFCGENLDDQDVEPPRTVDTKDGEEPIEISWKSDEPVRTVVLKYGQIIENFSVDGAEEGTVRVGDGNVRLPIQKGRNSSSGGSGEGQSNGENNGGLPTTMTGQSASDPCPDSGVTVKYEYDGDTDEFVLEEE